MRIIKKISILLSVTLLICSCNNLATNDSNIKSLRDSLAQSQKVIDSLVTTDANLFDKALKIEKDSADKAILIYREIANKHIDASIDSYMKAPYFAKQALCRIHYLESLRFLKFIKSDNTENIDVNTYHQNFKIANVDSFLFFISKRNFEIYDANEIGHENTKLTIDELRKEITERKGHAYEIIAQLSYMCSMPYSQYSQTDFAVSTDDMTGIYITMGGNYRLSFQFDGNDKPYKLAKIESYHIDDL